MPPMPVSQLFRVRDLGTRDNALNLLRLVLALLVLFSHAHILAGVGDGVVWQGQHLGSWAVIGFFAISGYLISGARLRSDAGQYLINRVVRIFPGYVLVLLVVALVMAPVAHVVDKGTIEGYFSAAVTPGDYVWGNLLLHISSYGIGTTLSDVPYPGAWNGSLWSLYYEFWCYIIIGVFLSWAVTRRHAWPTVALFAASVAAQWQVDRIERYVNANGDIRLMIFMVPYFLGGAIMYQLRDRVPLRHLPALACLVVAVACIVWAPESFGKQLASPAIAYVVLYLGAVLPSPGVTKVHDVSYGVYIFHFPVIQLLIVLGVLRHGFVVLLAASTAVTFVLATLSWFGVERAFMRWSRGKSPWGDLRGVAR